MVQLLEEAWMLAIETLSWMDLRKLGERLALARTIDQLKIRNPQSIRLAQRLVVETTRRRNLIDRIINYVMKPSSIGEQRLGVQAFLRLFVYETRLSGISQGFNIRTGEKAAQLARSILGWKSLEKIEEFLGHLMTQDLDATHEDVGDEERVGLLTYHPTWFVKYCFKLFGRRRTLDLLVADMEIPTTYLRLNTLKGSREENLRQIRHDGVELEKVDKLKHVYRVAASERPLTKTRSFKQGLFYIQDKASCLGAEAANLSPGMVVLDVCASPGAKTTYLAQMMRNKGVIYSLDYSRRRMRIWKNELFRMGASIAVPIIADACNALPFTLESDVLLLDPPCTSTGAFRRAPSSKWRLTRRSIDKMARIQWKMLNNCAVHVKSGGVLIYSTCSITVEENEMIIERFLGSDHDFFLTKITPRIGLPGLRGLDECRRLYTDVHDCNGFFVARLQRD